MEQEEQDIQATETHIHAPETRIKYNSDWTLWACYIILCVVSIVEVFSASSLELKNGSVYLPITSHVQFLLLGFVLVFAFEHVHYKYTKALMYLLGVVAVALAILTPHLGQSINGAVRSINIMGISIQAAEFCKLASAMLLAYYLSKFQRPDGKGLSTTGVKVGFFIIFGFVILLISQGGSNALLILMVGVTMMILAVLPRKLILYSLGALVAIMIIVVGGLKLAGGNEPAPSTPKEVAVNTENGDNTTVVVVSSNEQKNAIQKFFGRFSVWENRINEWLPGSTPEYEKETNYGENSNSQKHHAYMAIAHGNGIGVMPGNSRECARLQLAFSDYIYAIILEEMGLWGGFIVLLCYLGIIIRACMISRKCKSAYAALLIMGMALVISYQAFYHMCISVGVLPVSGQPLPFISKGGTSILIMSVAMGIMLSVSRYAVQRTPSGLKTIDDDAELPEDLRADNPTGGY